MSLMPIGIKEEKRLLKAFQVGRAGDRNAPTRLMNICKDNAGMEAGLLE